MVGRKRKPTYMHIVQGTAQPCRMNKNEPKAPKEPPRSAIDLSARASFWYGVIVGRIQSLGIASSADSENIMCLAIRLAQVEECDKDIQTNGRYFKIPEYKTYCGEMIYDKENKPIYSVKIIQNPSVAERSEALRHTQSLLAEFGLSAATRAKVSKITESPEPANRWEALK